MEDVKGVFHAGMNEKGWSPVHRVRSGLCRDKEEPLLSLEGQQSLWQGDDEEVLLWLLPYELRGKAVSREKSMHNNICN